MTIIEFINAALSNFLLLVSKSPLLQGILGFWLLLALFNQEHRKKLVDNLSFFLRMPLTYDDKEENFYTGDPKNAPLYPRRWFADAAKGLKSGLAEPFKNLLGSVFNALKFLGVGLSLDSIMGGAVLSGFMYADVIGGINILSLIPGLITWNIPVWLSEYSITIVAGTIFSVFVSAWAWTTLENTQNTKVTESSVNKIRKNMAWILLASSLITILGINLSKLPVFVEGFSEGFVEFLDQVSGFFLHVMVMFNAAIATFLLDKIGRKGLVILALPVLFAISVIFWVVSFVLSLIAGFGPVSVDIIIRMIFIVMNILTFYAIAPIDLGGSVFLKKNSQ
ncbi:hypothetical protein KC799_22145 [candidate division KSB1 bacterium]|nr:hypothetical protein [candidate division KSB1 bacterium]